MQWLKRIINRKRSYLTPTAAKTGQRNHYGYPLVPKSTAANR